MNLFLRHLSACMLLLSLLCLQTGCIKEDTDACMVKYTLTARAYDVYGLLLNADVCQDVILYFYTADLRYTHRVECSLNETIEVWVPAHSSIHVVGWGNVLAGNHLHTPPAVGDHESSCTVSLTTYTRADNHALPPADLFHGTVDVAHNSLIDAYELRMTRKAGQMAITVTGMDEFVSLDDNNYYIEVDDTYSSIVFDGTLTGSRVNYMLAEGYVESNGKEIYSNGAFNLLPEIGLTVRVYHGGNLVASTAINNKTGTPINVSAGQLTNVLIVLSRNDNGEADLNLQIAITDWNQVYLWKDFGR